MWVPSTWEREEDLLNDIILMAEYTTFPEKEADVKVPETIVNYRKQMALNQQKPLNSDLDDSASYIVSGRGRGMKDRVIRPGGFLDHHPSDEVELKKQIREVAGLGYSNELIEQTIKSNCYDSDKSESSVSFKPMSSSNSGASSSHSSPRKNVDNENEKETDKCDDLGKSNSND